MDLQVGMGLIVLFPIGQITESRTPSLIKSWLWLDWWVDRTMYPHKPPHLRFLFISSSCHHRCHQGPTKKAERLFQRTRNWHVLNPLACNMSTTCTFAKCSRNKNTSFRVFSDIWEQSVSFMALLPRVCCFTSALFTVLPDSVSAFKGQS